MGAVSACSFDLPWPPSVNRYYRHVGPRVLISREGRKSRMMTVSRLGGLYPKFLGLVSIYAEFFPPDRRRRDLDNVGGKALLDSLVHAGLMEDDSQIKELHLKMLDPIPGGLVHVVCKEISDG